MHIQQLNRKKAECLKMSGNQSERTGKDNSQALLQGLENILI